MNDPARQASPLLTRLASRPVASSLLRSTLSGISQPATSIASDVDPVDDDIKLALFDSVLDEISPQAISDTVPTNTPSSQSLTLPQSQSQSQTDDLAVTDTFEIPDQVRNDDTIAQNDDIVAQPDPLVSMMNQSMPSDQFLPDTLNISPVPTTSSRTPESVPAAVPTAEVPGITYVEQEPNNFEIPVEVEGFLERVADHADKLPQEIVIQGDNIALNQAQPIKQAVIMLPISEEDEKLAKGKNPTWSIAWLVSWSQKIIKKFTGQVVYSHTPTQVANS